MKLKYYMRGLGIGILLTVLILSFANPKEKLTDQEIISRAKELGMEMKEDTNSNLEQVLQNIKPTGQASDASVTPQAQPTVAPTLEPAATSAAPSATVTTPGPAATEAPIEDPAAQPTQKPAEPTILPTEVPVPTETITPEASQTDSDTVTFTIKSGMSSGKVAIMLESLGLVDDADKFNEYIVKEDKASIIRVGTYEVPKNVTYKELITKITTRP